MFKRVVTMLFLLGALSSVLAQAGGKISGIVRDKDTGESLPGVNVVIQESLLGASTDVDGTFIILNVPPGNHTVSFSYVGYQSMDIEGVRVVTDITKRLDVTMSSTTLDLGTTVTVTAEKVFFEASATNTVRVLDSEEIGRIPVKGVNSIVAVNAGVVVADGSGGQTDNATLNVRGGRGNETLFIVDGVAFNDAVFGNAAGTIPDAAIEQVSSQFGGFNAKYGSAQSAVVNITTKSGSSKYFGGIEAQSSGIGEDRTRFNTFTTNGVTLTPEQLDAFQSQLGESSFDNSYTGLDEYGFNQFTAFLGGPVIPGNTNLAFFGSAEYVNTLDDNPRAGGLSIPSANLDQNWLPDNSAQVWRFTGKLDAYLGDKFKITGSGNASLRDGRDYTHSYAKNNSFHNPNIYEDVISGSLKLTNTLNTTTFWDLTLRSKYLKNQRYDGFWDDDIFAYGDAARNAEVGVVLPNGDGSRITRDDTGVFWSFGRVFDNYRQYEVNTLGGDLNFTKQMDTHLLEFGATLERNTVRYYSLAPVDLSLEKNSRTLEERYYQAIGSFYGYDLEGNAIDSDNLRTINFNNGSSDAFMEAAAPQPVTVAFFLQDRIEFQDFILNLGFRYDYFDPDFVRLANLDRVLGDNNRLDESDFEDMPTESYISPRLGFAFPVSPTTVFHAQYGVFRQAPRSFDLYDSWVNLDVLEQRDGQGQNNGHLKSEETVQYEFGFKKQFGQTASLDLTAYYKNVKGLTNVTTQFFTFGGTTRNYITTTNADFGTVKGIATSFTLRQLGPVSAKMDYTLALNEGTGSSQSSSQTATFRNNNNEVPKSIAPLDFDQRHTLTANVDIRAGKDEGPSMGGLHPLANAGANFLVTFNSGRPYTPRIAIDPIGGSSLVNAETENTINSAYADGIFRIDMKVDKRFNIGRMSFVPYLLVQNLLDRKNFISVYESTGRPDDSAWLSTPEGSAQANREGSEWISDFHAFEADPENYGLPRLMRLGVQIKF